jgi:hypothetical protein
MPRITQKDMLEGYQEILDNNLEDFREGDKKERRKILNDVWKELKELQPEMSAEGKRSLKKVSRYRSRWDDMQPT